MNMIEPSAIYDEHEAAKKLSVSVNTLRRWRRTPGGGPRFSKVGQRTVYLGEELLSWIKTNSFDVNVPEFDRKKIAAQRREESP